VICPRRRRQPDDALGGEHADDQQRRADSSAAPGVSPSSAHELASATTGASRIHGTTLPDG
jgi:hypothetical protein